MLSSKDSLTVAIDIGGTFTDIALLDHSNGKIWRAKTPSVPSDPSEAFLNGIRLVLKEAGRSPSELTRVLHGTTVATNMILEGKGARTALVTTSGFRHVLTIGRQDIPRNSNLYTWVKPTRPVPASRVFEVRERISAGGMVDVPLDEENVRDVGVQLQKINVDAVAICFLHAFANSVHEERVAQILREMLPGVAVTVSSDVLPVVREFERTLTTVLNATVMPGVESYVRKLEQRLNEEAVSAPLLLMQSNGGVAGADAIRRAPALTALSGPAAGVVGAMAAAEACDISDLITVDIGGTSADICLIKDGKIGLTHHGRVGEWALSLPMVDMVTIGAGGGSIARFQQDTLLVGPHSAGARPGPAAYGHGGTHPTVTDAHVVLGHLPATLLGGRMQLDRIAAHSVVQNDLAEPMGISVYDAARGILAIADNHMVGAMRIVSVERGHDPRQFTLVPFGGAGPLHGCSLASLLGISKVMIPPAPGILCADGLLCADIKAEFSRALPKAGEINITEACKIFSELEEKATNWFVEEGVSLENRQLSLIALLRYFGQGGEVAVDWAPTRKETEANFVARHQALYGFTLNADIELVTLRVEAIGIVNRPPRQPLCVHDSSEQPLYSTVHFSSGEQSVRIIERSSLSSGTTLDGPIIVTQLDATTLIPPNWNMKVHESGALLLTQKGENCGSVKA